MRDEFSAIISGWTLTSDRTSLSERLVDVLEWIENNNPLEPDEEKTIEMMIHCEIVRGIEEGDFDDIMERL